MVTDSIDFANARLEFLNGSVANLTVSRVAIENVRRTKFIQKDTLITVDYLNKSSKIYSIATAGEVKAETRIPIAKQEGQEEKEIIIKAPKIILNNAIFDELTAFLEAIENNSPLVVPLEDGHNAVAVAHQILEKINNKL